MAKKNFGAQFWLGSALGVPTRISGLLSVKAPSLSRGTIDTTTHESEDGIMTFMGEGVADPGEGTAQIEWIPGSTGDGIVLDALAKGDVRSVQIFVNGNNGKASLTGECIITSYEPDDQPVQGKQAATIGFKASGKFVWDYTE
ncbi:phage tail tube protein [Sphingomonas faeni]|uniref:phage tail tube protein n=1 Tax=Sphingomonas faeni TaxID=185950 RepID=UPI0033506F90